jgi:hypothetical protein
MAEDVAGVCETGNVAINRDERKRAGSRIDSGVID